jgi:dTDP-4-dehydrorhamnose reductase/SAM-dependent methyltransferase
VDFAVGAVAILVILILGASGIVGQHLRVTQPEDVSAVYTSMQQSLPRDFPLKLQTKADIEILLERWTPSVVINLAGENRPDVVERDPLAYEFINVLVPFHLAEWCQDNGKRLIHVSTQGVLGGREAPYSAHSLLDRGGPVNEYGLQKLQAENYVMECGGCIARLTFVLGVRPFPHVGRPNPAEQMIQDALTKRASRQVYDRTFSVCFARDAAEALWTLALSPHRHGVVHVGEPGAMNRFRLAQEFAIKMGRDAGHVEPVQHDTAFPAPAWAQRPLDTTYAADSMYSRAFYPGMTELVQDWRRRLDYFDLRDRATEIATFLGMPVEPAVARLALGFGANHVKVAEDFRGMRPDSDARLLEWYRGTDAYIWELTAYHLDQGFNYRGMCQGLIEHLKGAGCQRVLSLGDGVGDFTIQAREAGLRATYHDLQGSRTSNFAAFRIARRQLVDPPVTFLLTASWEPVSLEHWHPEGLHEYLTTERVLFDAVIALDFFEHLTDVEAWARAVFGMLRPGGTFLAQNAFGIGDDEHEGSIPMHLVRNNRFVKDWEPLLRTIGFTTTGNGWWNKP